MTKGVLIALGVAVAVLGAIAIFMTGGGRSDGLRGGVPFYTPSSPLGGGPPLPAANKLSSWLQVVSTTAASGSMAADNLTTLWNKTGKNWFADAGGPKAEDTYDESFVNTLIDA